ncbi:DsbA family protein [Haloechinothrix halophila]|uniref:DsbA family protein n=1 Tax=Haloechinothrix halophila TaxID=1069073 RepID=UPI0003FD5997|nr:thioredoxin domain-containing protein [Haloechinothrix halophila]
MSKEKIVEGGRAWPSANVLLTIGVVVVAIIVFGGVLLSGGDDQPQGSPTASDSVLLNENSHRLTDAGDNAVTVVEFLDFQCPACAGYYRNITADVEQDYGNRITFVVRNFPLDNHSLALPAAQAAEAAGMQGKYAEMYHALYENYEQWAVNEDGDQLSDDEDRARAAFDSFAEEIGLDVDRFHADMASDAVAERIEADKADGEKAQVTGTPTLFINGERFTPSGETFAEVKQQFREKLDAELAQ